MKNESNMTENTTKSQKEHSEKFIIFSLTQKKKSEQ